MRKQPKYVTRERTKSHLQKYRITKDRNKDDFLEEYASLLKKTQAIKQKELQELRKAPIPKVILSKALNGKKATKLIGGQAAALLSFSVMNNCSTDHGPDQIAFQGTKTEFPKLTEHEQQTSLGASLLYVKGLLHNMTDVLLKERHGLTDQGTQPASRDYDSSSSSEEEDYFDLDEEDSKNASSSVEANSRKPSPGPAGTLQHPHHPGTSMPPAGPYGYPGIIPVGPPSAYPQPFPRPFGFGGPGPARPMLPYPQHPPHFNQGSYHHGGSNFNQGTYHHGPPQPPQPPPFAGTVDPSMHHQGIFHHYPQGQGDYYFQGHEDYPPPRTTPPYPDDPNNGSFSETFQQPPPSPKPNTKRSKSDEGSSRRKKHERRSGNKSNSSREQSGRLEREDKRQGPRGKPAPDQNVLASPLVREKKRKRQHRPGNSGAPLAVSVELEEDRGIPGASKVASPFHRETKPSPITSNVKRGRSRRPDRQELEQKTPPASADTQNSFFMDSPFNEVYQAIQKEDQQSSRSKSLAKANVTPKAQTGSNEKDFSPDWMFEEAHLSPGEMSIASKMSHDGQQLAWEPLAIDMNEHLADDSRPPSVAVDEPGSPSHSANVASNHNPGRKDSPDTHRSTRK
ncbi:MAG: hypothetical protein SGILL_007811 [Bacillariaceae sp.]